MIPAAAAAADADARLLVSFAIRQAVDGMTFCMHRQLRQIISHSLLIADI